MPQSKERSVIAQKVITRVYQMNQVREQKYALLRNRSPLEAIEDGIKKVAQYKIKPSYKKGWQQNLAGSIITDKLFEFLAKLAARAMETNVFPSEEVSYIGELKAKICNSILKCAARKNNDDFQLVMEMIEGMQKGTVVGIEGWKHYKKKVKSVINEDPETGEQKYKEEEYTAFNDVWGDIWPLERVLFGNVFVSHVQKMSEIALERVVKWDQWQAEYKGWPDADKVMPKSNNEWMEGSNLFYTPSFVANDEVYEIRYYNQDTNEFCLLANSVWINPLSKATVRPIPYRHHKLPIWSVRFRPIVQDFIYGMSHPDSMIASSDTYDKVLEAMLDVLIIGLNAPISADEQTKGLSEGYLYPNKVIRLKTGQREPKRIDLGGLSAESIKLLQVLQSRLESNAASAEMTGQVKKTATQIVEEQQAALETVALFLRFMEFGIRDKAELRLANALQFYSMPIHKKDKELKFQKIILRDELLANGEIGTKEITFTTQPSQSRVMMDNLLAPGNTEKIEASPAFIRDFKYDLELVPNSSLKRTESLIQSLELNKQRVISALHPQKFMENQDMFYKDILKVFHNDPSKYNQQQKEGGFNPMGNPPMEVGQEPKLQTMPQEPTLREVVNA